MERLWKSPTAPAPKPAGSSWHRSHYPAQKWHRNQERSGSLTQRPTPLEPANGARPREEHPGLKTLELGPSSPVPFDSLSQVIEEVELPSTPDTFEAARDLIAMTAPWSPVLQVKPLVPQSVALPRGKAAMLRHSAPPVE
ncbi:hypothetical protein UY3_12726 [Chelonia mydas]|uniref:Uncharacterized protein n=1 Tax=Chelonia mydas TaxID=8469 RepID=M7BDC1_CHEMY|nr:hypothetical protein UY3_12726 [Chelonia mydas]